MNKIIRTIAVTLSVSMIVNTSAYASDAFAKNNDCIDDYTIEREASLSKYESEKSEKQKTLSQHEALKVYSGSFEEYEQKLDLKKSETQTMALMGAEEEGEIDMGRPIEFGKPVYTRSVEIKDEGEGDIQLMALSSDTYSTLTRPSFINNIYTPAMLERAGDVYVSPFSGDVQINVTDIILPGRNGLDLNLNHFYQSSHSDVEYSDKSKGYEPAETTYYNERYALGLGWSFGFPSVEQRMSSDGEISELYYHDGTGATYRYNKDDQIIDITESGKPVYNGYQVYSTNLDNYYTDNVIFNESDHSYKDGDFTSKYSFKTAENTMQYFGKSGEIRAIVDRFGNKIKFDYDNYPGNNLLTFGDTEEYTLSPTSVMSRDKSRRYVVFNSSTKKDGYIKTEAVNIDKRYKNYRVSFMYENPLPDVFKDGFSGTLDVEYEVLNDDGDILDTVKIAEGLEACEPGKSSLFQRDINIKLTGYGDKPAQFRVVIRINDGEEKIGFYNFRVSPMRPLISKITDTIGRTLEFEYTGDIYVDYESSDFPLTVTVKEPDGSIYRTIEYYRQLHTAVYEPDPDTTEEYEKRFYFLWGSDNEEAFTCVEYSGFDGKGRSDGYTETTSCYEFSNRYIVTNVDFDYYDTTIEYEKSKKRIGIGYTDTWRVKSAYENDHYIGDESKHYNETNYNYKSGRFTDETGYNMSKKTSGLDASYGSYIVDVTSSNGSVHRYEYTDHTFKEGRRIVEQIKLPLIDSERIMADGDSITTEYTYDDKDFIAINSPQSAKTTESIDGQTRTYINNYKYDDDSCMVSNLTLNLTEAESKANKFPTAKTKSILYGNMGNRLFLPIETSYYREENGELLSVNTEYDSLGRVISEINENGEVINYEYDANYSWLPSRVYYEDPMNVGDNTRVVETLYEYGDEYGLGPTAVKVKTADGEYAESYIEYEPQYGNVISETDADGNETAYRYDKFGRLEYVYEPSFQSNGGEAWTVKMLTYLFHSDGRTIVYDECLADEKCANFDSDNVVESIFYDYDAHGNITEIDNLKTHKKEKIVYDLSGRPIAYQNFDDYGTNTNTVEYTYDGFDRVISVKDKLGNKQTVDYKSLQKDYSFISAEGDAKNHYTEIFDMYGHLTEKRVYPEGTEGTPIVQTYEYNLVGNLLSETDGNGKTTSYEYDNIGNPVAITMGDGSVVKTKFAKFGVPVEVTRYDDGEGYTIAKTYDDRGLEISSEQKGLDIYGRAWYYEYTNGGNLSKITEPNGNKKAYGYDGRNNLTYFNLGSESREYDYDYRGLVTKAASKVNGESAQSESYSYGKMGELVSKTVNGRTIGYEYNSLYNLSKITTPNGHERTYARDELERVITIAADGKEFKHTYYDNGMIKDVIYPTADIVTSYTYDNANQVTSVVTKKGTEVLAGYEYKYDKAGNITEISGGENVTYTYDDLYRLSSYTKDGITVSYTYDGRGNIIAEESSDGNLVTYAYSGDNRLEKKTESGVETTYEYDLNGNLISDSTGNRYSYDENNKLVYAKVDGEEARYTIGLDGLRTSKTTADGTVEYYTDESGLVVSENSDQIIWGNRALAKKIGSSYYYYIYNAHGDVVMMTDESGNIVNSYSYDPWGVVTSETETVDNSIKYAGEYYDEETGLIYLRARYYDPSIGRFTQEDRHWNSVNMIYGDNDENQNHMPDMSALMQSVNGYVYCMNNPVKYGDYDGEIAIVDDAVIIAFAAVILMSAAVTVYFASGKSNPHDLERGMSKHQKGMFQREIEDWKNSRGMRPNDNIPWQILVALAKYIKENYK